MNRQLLKKYFLIGCPGLDTLRDIEEFYPEFLSARFRGNDKEDVQETTTSHSHVKALGAEVCGAEDNC